LTQPLASENQILWLTYGVFRDTIVRLVVLKEHRLVSCDEQTDGQTDTGTQHIPR